MGDAARVAVGIAVFFVPAGAGAWRDEGVGVDEAGVAFVFVGAGAGLAEVAAARFAVAVFFTTGVDTDCAAADFGACAGDAFFAGAFETTAFFALADLEATFAAEAFLAGALRTAALVAAFFGADLATGLAGFFATAFFAGVFFAAGFLAGAAFLAALAAFFAVFFAATGGVSFYSLVTGKRAVIP